jgi:hypothetical protein
VPEPTSSHSFFDGTPSHVTNWRPTNLLYLPT